MAILDNILGGGEQASADSNSNDFGLDFGTNPGGVLGIDSLFSTESVDDDGDSSSTTIGDGIGLGFSVPTLLGLSSSSESDSASVTDNDNGGLLGGLL